MSPRLSAHWLFLLIGLAACTKPVATRTVDVESCDSLRAQGAGVLRLSSARPAQFTISGETNAVNAVEVEVVNGRLQLAAPVPGSLDVLLDCPGLRVIELLGAFAGQLATDAGMIEFEKVAVYGASSFAAEGLGAEALDLRAAGSAQIDIARLVAESVQVLASGTARVAIGGEAAQLKAELAGDADLAAGQLMSQAVEIQARGASRASVAASAHLSAKVEGSAQVRYRGAPDLAIERQDQGVVQQY